jgi:maltose O-acetyltransferase
MHKTVITLRRLTGIVYERTHPVYRELIEWFRALLRAIPGELGCWLRNRLYGFRAASGVRVLSQVFVYCPGNLRIGARSGISSHCQIHAGGGIDIGNDVLIGPGVLIWSQSHNYHALTIPIRLQGWRRAPIVIEDDVWIGGGAIILPGVRLSRGTVVAAGAVVTHSSEPNTVVAGVPGRQIARRDEKWSVEVSPRPCD